jgi:hypothetical protein
MVAFARASSRSVYQALETPHSATVSILAISSSIHRGSGNQEIYIADLVSAKGEHQLIKLVDAYPSSGDPISVSALRKRPSLTMKLRHDSQCDVAGKLFFLPMDDHNIFDGSIREQLAQHGEDILPCFQVEHQFTRLKK